MDETQTLLGMMYEYRTQKNWLFTENFVFRGHTDYQRIDVSEQLDSSEFLSNLLDRLLEEMTPSKSTIFKNIFHFKLIDTKQCCVCGTYKRYVLNVCYI